jgi:hypothetical protein
MKLFTEISGTAKPSFVVACSDVVQTFSDAQMQNSNGALPIACLVVVEGEDIRFAFDADPVQGAQGSGVLGTTLFAGQSYLISNPRNIQNFRFINAVNAVNGFLQVSMFYEIGK